MLVSDDDVAKMQTVKELNVLEFLMAASYLIDKNKLINSKQK